MIKPPSLVREYTWVWSGDPALDTPPKDATKKQHADWTRKLKNARNTGVYDGVMKAGEKATTFQLRLIPNDTWLSLVGLVKSGVISDIEWPTVAARLALRSIADSGIPDEVEVALKTDPDFARLGPMAQAEALNQFGPLATDIFGEMFSTILERQQAPRPK